MGSDPREDDVDTSAQCRRDDLGGCWVHESIWPEGRRCRIAQGDPSGSYDYGLPPKEAIQKPR